MTQRDFEKDLEIRNLKAEFNLKEAEAERYKRGSDTNFIISIFTFCAATLIIILFLYAGSDNLDKDILGRFLCEKNNATLSSVEFDRDADNCVAESCELKTLKIVCQRNNEIPLEDHYLYIIGDNEKGAKK